MPETTSYYYLPNKIELREAHVLPAVGINPAGVCPEVLASLGLYRVVDKMENNLFSNPNPTFEIHGNVAWKVNSEEDIHVLEAKSRVHAHLAKELDNHISSFTVGLNVDKTLVIAAMAVGELDFPFLYEKSLHSLKETIQSYSHTLQKVLMAETTQEIKQIYEEFTQSDSPRWP